VGHQHDRVVGILGARPREARRRTRIPREQLPRADFRFPQDEDHDAIAEVAAGSSALSDWSKGFLDNLYVSVTNSSAFSPTDAMPLSHRMKMLMASQSVSAVVLSVIVIARGVSLPGETATRLREG
jgi:hypothetical protein